MKIKRKHTRAYIKIVFIIALIIAGYVQVGNPQQKKAHAEAWIKGGWDELQIGSSSSCARDAGELYCWGFFHGQGYFTYPTTILRDGDLGTNPISVGAVGYQHSCEVANKKAYCFGVNSKGQVGIGQMGANVRSPTAVDTTDVLKDRAVTAVAGGSEHSCAVADGQAFCWGSNDYGQLGDGTKTDSAVPVAVNTSGVLAGKTVTAVSAGAKVTCVLADGKPYCWGIGSYGTLGNGSLTDSSVPVAVDASGVLNGKTITAIDSGAYYTCVVASGQVYCWGYNRDAQLGIGNYSDQTTPTAVDTALLGGKNVTKLAIDRDSSCVLADGTPYCWGLNTEGQLGSGNTASTSVPVQVATDNLLSGKTITDIGIGSEHACVLANRQAYCWGANVAGQLGDGTNNRSLVPVAVAAQPLQMTGNTYRVPTGNGDFTINVSVYELQQGATVTIGGQAASVVAVDTNTATITVKVPSSQALGSVDIVVTNPDGRFGVLPDALTYEEPQPLSIRGFDTYEVPLQGADHICVTGHGFEPGMSFLLGDLPVSNSIVFDEANACFDIPGVTTERTVTSLRATTPNGISYTRAIHLDFYTLKRLSNAYLGSAGDKEVSSSGYLQYSYGIAADGAGTIYATDSSANTVKVFNKTGAFVTSFGSQGSGDGEFERPMAIKLGPDGLLYILDATLGRIQVFTKDGAYVRQFGVYQPNGLERYAEAMAIDLNGNVYVGHCDYEGATGEAKSTIDVFSQAGTFIKQIGKNADGTYGFECITGLEVSVANTLYAFDSTSNPGSNDHLKVYSTMGTFEQTISETGIGNGRIGKIQDIAFDSYGNLFLVDSSYDRVQVFDKNMNYLGQIGSTGDNSDEFSFPLAMAVTHDNKLLIFDTNHFAIKIFAGMVPPAATHPQPTKSPTAVSKQVELPSAESKAGDQEAKTPTPLQDDREAVTKDGVTEPTISRPQESRATKIKGVNPGILQQAAAAIAELVTATTTFVDKHPTAVVAAATGTVVSASAVGYVLLIKP